MKILAIIVAYNQDIMSSATFQSLIGAFEKNAFENALSILIYDNSPTSQTFNWSVPTPMSYVHDPTNAGLAKAYNYALDVAVSNGCDWLLLLDQDSYLPKDFITILINTADTIKANKNLVAIVPRVECMGKTISPSILKLGGRFRPIDSITNGICHFKLTSINSGTMLRTSFMKTAGGFNPLFWLDYLDHWVFSTIYSNNKMVFISGSVIKHELSVMDYNKWVNLERYEGILKAEMLFITMYRPKYDKYFYMLRLLYRIGVQLFKQRKRVFYKATLRMFMNVLFNRKGSLQ